MNILRKLGLSLLGVVLFLSLLSTAWSHIEHTTLGNRETVKGWLNESGFYDHIVESVLDNVNKNTKEGEDKQEIPVDNPQIQTIVAGAFSPSFLRTNVEKALDGTYNWLEGKTAKPEFTIDLAEAKQKLADGLGNYAITRATSLPACTPEQLAELSSTDGGDFDALSAPCLPPGVNAQTAGAELRNQIMSSQDFLKQTTYSGDDIKVTSEGQEVAVDQAPEFKRIQQSYKLATYWPYIAAIVAILSAVGVVFLSSTKRKGIRRAGIVTLVAGICLGFSYMGFTQLSGWLNKRATDVGGGSAVSNQLINDAVRVVTSDITSLLKWYALGFSLVGLAAILLTIFVGRSKQPATESKSPDPEPPVDDSPKSEPAKTSNSAPSTPANQPDKSKKKEPRKIQL